MFGMLKMIPFVLLIGLGAYGYHTVKVNQYEAVIAELRGNNQVLKSNQIQLESAIDREVQAREQIEENLERQLSAVSDLTSKNAELTAERDEYLSIFRRHDLTKLARAKPGLIEPRINRGTAEVFRSIEKDSKEVSDADS